jgi:cyclophilin family peptidyl-prolyl cis-trans isomerase
MASLNLMPHAVNTFLRQVDLKLWDKTVFWHHDGIDHIISASPVLFDQAGTKNHHFEAMGVRELGFAEYSPDYPHEELTLGFSDRGPNFYINILNNTIVHGPGGQGGSRAKDHADPCFGKIIDGLDTVREMYKLQLRQSSKAAKRHEWHDDEVTKIVSVTILK